jgi:hypothetical protein
MVVDDEGECHVGSCRWAGNDEGRVLGLNQVTRFAR